MTALQLAKQECANYESDGTCNGLDIRPDGTLFAMDCIGEKCLIARGERCRYFEDAVLYMKNVTRDEKERDQLEDAEHDYELKLG